MGWIRKTARNVTLATMIAASYVVTNEMINAQIKRSPTEPGVKFTQQYGIPLHGFAEDIENSDSLAKIAAHIQREKIEMPFGVRSIEIISDRTARKPFHYQLTGAIEYIRSIFSSTPTPSPEPDLRNSGQHALAEEPNVPLDGPRVYMPPRAHGTGFYAAWSDTMDLSSDLPENSVTHEIKHVKTSMLLYRRPEFKNRWVAIAKNDYPPWPNYVMQLAEVTRPSQNDEKSAQLAGFVSAYGRVNFYEDIATVCADAEAAMETFSLDSEYSKMFVDWLYGDKNQKIIEKTQLAQEYGLLPKEFSEGMLLQKLYRDCWKDAVFRTGPVPTFLVRSEEFLRRHPTSVYEIEVREARGVVLNQYAVSHPTIRGQAPREWKKALQSRYKQLQTYEAVLAKLRTYYQDIDHKQSALYNEAIVEFEHRLATNDVRLAITGVDDLLR